MGLFRKIWLNTASENALRKASDKLEKIIHVLDNNEKVSMKKLGKYIDKENDIANAIAHRFPINLPKREHGWYIKHK